MLTVIEIIFTLLSELFSYQNVYGDSCSYPVDTANTFGYERTVAERSLWPSLELVRFQPYPPSHSSNCGQCIRLKSETTRFDPEGWDQFLVDILNEYDTIDDVKYFCDTKRHLVCVPYSIENLHKMADALGIKRCWFHKDHYDIPKTRIAEIAAKCEVVSSKEIVKIIRK